MTETEQFRFSLLLREIDNLLHDDEVASVALVLVQFDGLAEINERFGYLGGDKVLEEISRRMDDVARAQDRLVNISRTSFALLIRNPVHEGHAELGAEKIAQVTGEPVTIGSGRARVKARMGISMLPEPASSAEELLRNCEAAAAAARRSDASYVVYTDALATRRLAQTFGPMEVEEAIRNEEFALHYQPQIELRSGRLCGAEALVRWYSPHGGLIPPGLFIADIEHSRAIRALLWFVLNSGLRHSTKWIARVPGFSLSVNVAPGNLEDPDLVEIVESALSIWNFPAEQLTLEVTETALMHDARANAMTINRLRRLGVRASIDDFGTGYSSLSYLRNIPADELKIDKSFVRRIADDETDRKIVASVIQLAQAVNLDIVAEGIEDAGVMQRLLAMGCDIGQGFHFGAPVPAEEFETEWINRFARSDVNAG